MKHCLRKLLFVACLLISFVSAAQKVKVTYAGFLQPDRAVNAINMIMIHDVTSPPVAARYYAYCMLGAYDIVATHNKKLPAIDRYIKSYRAGQTLDTVRLKYDHRIAAYYSILESARLLLPSGAELKEEQNLFVQTLQKKGISQKLINNSVKVAELASAAVVAFSKTDHYGQLSALQRYTPLKDEGKWYPTPPAYFEAVEPNWKTIRTLVIDSANQYKPAPLIPFNKDTASAFYRGAVAVYKVSKQLTQDQNIQAQFWDCNPFAITTSGHMSIGYKKISPGGHWMNIAGLVSKKAELGFDESITTLTLTGVAIMDAFISCWEEKFASNRVRPETFINRYMDVKWQPVLQTPPFPEYTSGHAVISNAAAEVLTFLLGDNFAYTDNTEIPFGSGERKFTSFKQAAAEASVSRFYGGIHYMDSIENGNKQGQNVGAAVVKKIKDAGLNPFRP